jgi:hypothetical protein
LLKIITVVNVKINKKLHSKIYLLKGVDLVCILHINFNTNIETRTEGERRKCLKKKNISLFNRKSSVKLLAKVIIGALINSPIK